MADWFDEEIHTAMKYLLSIVFAAAAMAQAPQAAPTPAAGAQPMSEQAVIRIARAVQKEILTLPNYGVFDDIRFGIKDYKVILNGYASRPTLKSSAEQVVKKIEGVQEVVNNIEVLPLSPNDDNVRARVYVAIYYHPMLSRYNPNRGVPEYSSPARWAGGITNDPPIGYHPIHIIVKNGNVILSGVVANEGDRNIANIQANSVGGAFSVDNQLAVAESAKPKKAKK